MRLFSFFLITIFSSSMFSSTTFAASIWEAKGDQHFILFGTFHLLSQSDYPLPSVYDRSFEQCDTLWMEIDQAEFQDPNVIANIQKAMMLPAGELLTDQLSKEEYQMLSQLADEAGLNIQMMMGMKPWAVAITLTTTVMMNKGMDPELGLDVHLSQLAEKSGIPTYAFETVMEQFQMFESFDDSSDQQLIDQTIADLNDSDSVLTDMLAAWKEGDLETLWEISSMEEFPGIAEVMLDQRNNRWMKTLLSINTHGTHCIAVGGLHMAGETGLLNQLTQAGYLVTKP